MASSYPSRKRAQAIRAKNMHVICTLMGYVERKIVSFHFHLGLGPLWISCSKV